MKHVDRYIHTRIEDHGRLLYGPGTLPPIGSATPEYWADTYNSFEVVDDFALKHNGHVMRATFWADGTVDLYETPQIKAGECTIGDDEQPFKTLGHREIFHSFRMEPFFGEHSIEKGLHAVKINLWITHPEYFKDDFGVDWNLAKGSHLTGPVIDPAIKGDIGAKLVDVATIVDEPQKLLQIVLTADVTHPELFAIQTAIACREPSNGLGDDHMPDRTIEAIEEMFFYSNDSGSPADSGFEIGDAEECAPVFETQLFNPGNLTGGPFKGVFVIGAGRDGHHAIAGEALDELVAKGLSEMRGLAVSAIERSASPEGTVQAFTIEAEVTDPLEMAQEVSTSIARLFPGGQPDLLQGSMIKALEMLVLDRVIYPDGKFTGLEVIEEASAILPASKPEEITEPGF